MRIMRLWTWSEVAKAVPYLRSVIGSLREHWLDILNIQRQIDKTEAGKGPAKRQQMMDMQAHHDERSRAQAKFDDALEELNKVEVYLYDPIRGLAMIPCRKRDDLAWYVFDHFAAPGVIGWRYQNDPIDECRPLDEEMVANGATMP
jgi:hypothetical protein